MSQTTTKYRFNAKTWQFYLNGAYVPLSGVLLRFLYFLSFTVEHSPCLTSGTNIEKYTVNELRKQLGKKISHENAQELVECISGLGYRFNPGLISIGALIVENAPKQDSFIEWTAGHKDIYKYRPYSRRTSPYSETASESRNDHEEIKGMFNDHEKSRDKLR